jgi:putative holliday junction resolvase
MTNTNVFALDVGTARIGVALARTDTRLPNPVTTLANDEHFFDTLQQLITEYDVGQLVIGWPRGLNGQETDQTRYVAKFITDLKAHIEIPIAQQDEAVTSKQAEAELQARGKAYTKGDVDALSATYILEDFLGDKS